MTSEENDNIARQRNSSIDSLPPSQPSVLLKTEVEEINNPVYRYEAVRLQSFINWPVPFIEPKVLASAGLYYTNNSDRVRCFECHVEICQWERGDIPMEDHKRYSPRCRFVRGIPCGNVPIGVDPATVPPPSPPGRDVCGMYDMRYQPEPVPECYPLLSSELQLPSLFKSFGFERPKPPTYSKYITYEARLRTFDTWPKSTPPEKEKLADAGFFYIEKGDRTICYHCGGGLENWEPEDDPWQQHAKWFPKCYYLLTVKGQEYVKAVTGECDAPLNEEITTPGSEETSIENNPCPNNGSMDSGLESLSSSLSSDEESINDLHDTEARVPIDDARLCKICYNAELGIVFLPCGHMVACVKCAPDLTKCAVCRKPITLTVRAILS